MSPTFYAILVLAFSIAPETESAKILGMYAMPAPSHRNIMQSLFEELANRGHEVTVISPYPLKQKRPNYTDISIDITKEKVFGTMNLFEFFEMPVVLLMTFMWESMAKLSEMALKENTVQEFLKDETNNFDLVILEYFFCEAFLGFGHRYNAPVIGVTTGDDFEFVGDAVGEPSPYAYVPTLMLDYSDHMTFLQRLHNTFVSFFSKIGNQFVHMSKQEAVMRRYFKHTEDLPPLREMFTNTSLLLVNSHVVFNYPRPRVPSSVQVGGLHIKPPRKLPQDLQNFLDKSTEGVIYFSLGSNLKSTDMPIEKREIFIRVFSKLKYQVLWKFEDDSIKNLPKNVKIQSWFPQSDLLSHPNIRVFITHGGLLSTQEAIYNGVPLIGIPIFADQKINVKKAVKGGYAQLVEFHTLTEDELSQAIGEVAENRKYKDTVQRLSKIFHDQSETPMERAIFWTEYVIRHKGARHLRSAALDLAWYEYYLLDVIAVITTVIFIALSVTWLLTKALLRILTKRFRSKPQSKSSKKKN